MIGSFLRGKKKEKIQFEPQKTSITDLDKICGNDKDLCEALWHTMFINPKKIIVDIKTAEKKANDFEKEGKKELSRMWYHIAGGIALWKGDVTKVKKYFNKCAQLAPQMEYKLITKIPEKAVEKAQEYYQKFP